MTRMAQEQLDSIIDGFRDLYGGWTPGTPIEKMRDQWDDFLGRIVIPAQIEDLMIGNVRCRRLQRGGATRDKTILFLHGGGYQIGSARSHHNVMARLSEQTGSQVLGVEYRLAPEHRFPAPLEDALAVYRALLRSGVAASDIALCGDSAGGGLAVAMAATLCEQKLPLPAAIVAMSPWADMQARGETYETHADRDPVTQRKLIRLMARSYLGPDANPCDPLASPVHADLEGLPPLLIQVGAREVLLADAHQLAARAKECGVEVHLKIWPDMIHTFQLFTGRLDEADEAIGQAGRFLRDKLRHMKTVM